MLRNRIIYLNEKNEQEAGNQVSRVKKVYYQSHDLLLRLYGLEENLQEYHANRWRAWQKMATIFHHIEGHLQINIPREGDKLMELQESIQQVQFMPQL